MVGLPFSRRTGSRTSACDGDIELLQEVRWNRGNMDLHVLVLTKTHVGDMGKVGRDHGGLLIYL